MKNTSFLGERLFYSSLFSTDDRVTSQKNTVAKTLAYLLHERIIGLKTKCGTNRNLSRIEINQENFFRQLPGPAALPHLSKNLE